MLYQTAAQQVLNGARSRASEREAYDKDAPKQVLTLLALLEAFTCFPRGLNLLALREACDKDAPTQVLNVLALLVQEYKY
jgi:hypothetical protein